MAKISGWHRGTSSKKVIPEQPLIEDPLNIETIPWGDLTWVNIELATERETDWLADTYHFHPLALDDCVSRKQIPKIDVFPGYLFFVFYYPLFDKTTRVSSKRQWSAFIGE